MDKGDIVNGRVEMNIFIAMLGERAGKPESPSGGREVEMFIRKAKEGMCIKLPWTESQLNDLVQEGRELRPMQLSFSVLQVILN